MPDEKEQTDLEKFVTEYAMGFGANQFVAIMSPSLRTRFLVVLAKTYPEEWKEAVSNSTE